ncbi:unnamed protein product [Paramecium pentaurelia]|uniref:Uncharacterized protein n=1 Tax=Paramecium pentaurelia TaxID=43138 RepID=A0A8S1S5T6_9CILI|nr:unnamed protein product [Paramecium pentaurelia]CAD8134316.1 unnamed protein product [Paramecium pentaurelia]
MFQQSTQEIKILLLMNILVEPILINYNQIQLFQKSEYSINITQAKELENQIFNACLRSVDRGGKALTLYSHQEEPKNYLFFQESYWQRTK